MKALFKLLFGGFMLRLAGAVALGLVIWFAGPLLAFAQWHPLEGENARLGTIALVLVLWLGKRLLTLLRQKIFNRKLLDAMVPAPAKDVAGEADAEDLRVVRERFAQALGIMRHTGLGARKPSVWARLAGKQQYVYQLPWYIFIGPPGSGKTTALLNSGLRFPLADRIGEQPVRGIAGTRNCDWWFTDEAVMIDTAGRYVTQDSDFETDAREWREFMELLRRYRPRQPINGALVTVSLADLLQMSPAEREEQAAAVRNRVQELLKTLDTRFPVYLLVTKADLMPGFMEFFGDLSREQREQVWGTTFDFSEQKPVVPPMALFQKRFDELIRRIADLVPDRLQRERDVARRALIYGFAHQLATIKPAVMDFIGHAFPQSTLTGKVVVRGFYLTSGTQEGNPIDRVMGELGRQFGLQQQLLPSARPSGKSFFLTRLLHDVIFPEAPIAGTNLKYERRIGRIKWTAAIAATSLALLAFAGWTTSFLNNREYVQSVAAKAGELQKIMTQSGVPKDIKSLLPLYRTLAGFAHTDKVDPKDARLSQSLGLFQGHKLDEAAIQSYHRVLAQTLAPALAQRLAWVLRQGAPNPELQYETLKTYVMLALPEHLDREAVKGWVAFDLEINRGADLSVEERRELLSHIDALLSRNALQDSMQIDQALLARTRAALAATPFPQRVYRRLLRQDVGRPFGAFRIDNGGGPSASLVFQRKSGKPLSEGVPGLYTYDGYHRGFTPAVDKVISDLANEETWVLGIADSANARRAADLQGRSSLADEVKRLYLRDYAILWEQFVADVSVVQSSSLTQTIQTTRILSDADSPLVRLLRAIVREVSLTEVEGKPAVTLLDRASDTVQGTKQQLDQFFGRPQAAQPTAARTGRIETLVDDRFDTLRRFIRPGPGGAPAPVEKTTALIGEIYQLMNNTETAVKSGAAPPQSDVPDRVKADAARLPDPIRSMVRELAAAGAGQALGATRTNIDQDLASTVTTTCSAALNGRYPFAPGSSVDVTVDDFGRLFAPGGLLDDFFQKKLAAYVDTTVKPWKFRQLGDASLGGSSAGSAASLIQFQRAAEIRNVFFAGGAPGFSVKLEMKPLQMDPALLQFSLDMDGQVLKYAHGPSVPQQMRWPGTRGTNQIRIQVSPSASSGASGLLFEGPWAIFRMFDRAQIQPAAEPERFRSTFTIDGRPVVFDVTTSSVQNPFRLDALKAFRCPTRL
jgi:type VI secretion system protein ImpL